MNATTITIEPTLLKGKIMLNFSFQKIHAVLQLQVSVTHGVSKLSKCSEHLHLQMAIIYVSVTDRTTT